MTAIHCAYCAGMWWPSAKERSCPGCGAPPTFSAEDRRALTERGRWPWIGDECEASVLFGVKKVGFDHQDFLMTTIGAYER